MYEQHPSHSFIVLKWGHGGTSHDSLRLRGRPGNRRHAQAKARTDIIAPVHTEEGMHAILTKIRHTKANTATTMNRRVCQQQCVLVLEVTRIDALKIANQQIAFRCHVREVRKRGSRVNLLLQLG
jgi:hypothetical protein